MTRQPPTGEFWYLPMDLVRFGPGTIELLAAEAERIGATRLLVLTGHTLSTQTGLVDRIADVLGGRFAGVFAGCRQHTPYETVIDALEQSRSVSADALVSLGGGSVIDTARAVALGIGEGARTVSDLEAFRARYTPPDDIVLPATSGNALPHIAIPTTLSAAEFANAGAVTSHARQEKDLLIADELTPRSVILDPDVAVQTPADLWISTGMRSLDHAIETVYSPRAQPVTDVLSLDAIGRLVAALRATAADPEDRRARGEGQLGAWMSYFGEMNLTLGLSHAIGHQLGARHGIPHGITSCIIMPQSMRFLAPATADKQALIAEALGVDTAQLSAEEAAEAAAQAVEQLVSDLGLPRRLVDVGVDAEAFPALAEGVMQDLVVSGSPIPIERPEQIQRVLEMAA